MTKKIFFMKEQQERKSRLKRTNSFNGMMNSRFSSIKRIAYMCLAPIILLNNNVIIRQANGILNCFTPNMFKMGKFQSQQSPYGPSMYGGAERANWYGAGGPQQQVLNYPPYGLQMAGSYGQAHNPMK